MTTHLPQISENHFVHGALGDSISTGFNAETFGNNAALSWTTGTSSKLRSHSVRIRDALPNRSVITFNEAVAGARSDSLSVQTGKLLQAAPRFDYVTLLIGTNDLLQVNGNFERGLTGLHQQTNQAVERLIVHSPKVRVLVVGIPDLFRLTGLALNGSLGALARRFLSGASPDTLSSLHETFLPRWRAANAALRSLQSKFPNHVWFNEDVTTSAFDSAHVSRLDFFHPSTTGQARLAELTWHPEWLFADFSSLHVNSLPPINEPPLP